MFVLTMDYSICKVFSDNEDTKTMDLIPEEQWTDNLGNYDAEFISCKQLHYDGILFVDKSLNALRSVRELLTIKE